MQPVEPNSMGKNKNGYHHKNESMIIVILWTYLLHDLPLVEDEDLIA